MSDYTDRAYVRELEILDGKIAEKGAIAEKILADAIEPPINFNTNFAQATVNRDLCLGARDIEEQAILMIARRQPAREFREIISTIGIKRS